MNLLREMFGAVSVDVAHWIKISKHKIRNKFSEHKSFLLIRNICIE